MARRLLADRRGAVLPMLAVVLVFMIVAAGAGIDFARAVNQRQAIARGLDAAMLAVARELSTRNMTDAEIKQFLDDNYEAYFGANAEGSAIPGVAIVVDDPQIDTKARRIEVSAHSDVPTYFIQLAGMGPKVLSVNAAAQAIYPKSVEAALVVDVTGSMGGSKISALRDAAAGFVNTLIPPGTADVNEKVRVSLVPYSAGVNIGQSRATVATDGANKSRTSYPGCVTERDGAEAATDASYTVAPVGPGAQQASWGRAWYRSGNRAYSSSSYVCPTSELVPLTLDPGSSSQSGTLLHEISRLGAGGNTAGQTGILWGWYTLASSWSSLWPAASAPAAESDERVLKYLVVMTDGDFNTWFSPDRINRVTYDWIARQSGAGGESETRAKALCDAIKAKGITIISVGFQISKGSAADKVMSYCASGSENYYRADSNAALIAEFTKIANQIKSTYLSR